MGTLYALGKPLAVPAPTKGIVVMSQGSDPISLLADQVRSSNFDPAVVRLLRLALQGVLSTLPAESDAVPIDVELPITKVISLDTSVSIDSLDITVRPFCSSVYIDDKLTTKITGTDGILGILVAGERSCDVKAFRGAAGTEKEIGVVRFVAVDSDAATVLDVPRQPFAKTTLIYTFDNGRLVKSEPIRPSPVVTALSIPGRAIGGFVSGVTGSLDDKRLMTEAETERVKAETEKIKAAQEYEKLKSPPATANEASTEE